MQHASAVHAWAASEVTGVTRLTAVRAEGCVGWQLTRSAQPAMLGQVGGALSLAWHLCWPANSFACRHWAAGVACVMQVRACGVDWMGSQSVLSGRGDLLWVCMEWLQRCVAVQPVCPASSSYVAVVIFFVCTWSTANRPSAHKEGGVQDSTCTCKHTGISFV
jgi:hypothetical protein